MYHLQRDELIIAGRHRADEEERCIAAVDDFRVCFRRQLERRPAAK